MVVLIDTNIIVDFLMKREPYAEEAIKIVELCNQKKVSGCIAAHTISNLFYILRKEFSVLQRREVLGALCKV
ncbi:MAG: PIN domain-containing protein, partial [Lachnospiraceae bacterium]|nr:PIN domain-containing protein [Lachnospiraceae bacterium]